MCFKLYSDGGRQMRNEQYQMDSIGDWLYVWVCLWIGFDCLPTWRLASRDGFIQFLYSNSLRFIGHSPTSFYSEKGYDPKQEKVGYRSFSAGGI